MNTKKITTLACLLALCYILPLITNNIPSIGRMLLPLHIPVLLCGLLLGPIEGLLLGFLSITRFIFFPGPGILLEIVMGFELATYGFIAGLFYKFLKIKSKYLSCIISLIIAMIVGRIIWASGRYILSLLFNISFSFEILLDVGFINAIPGIVIQLILIPILVKVLEKTKAAN